MPCGQPSRPCQHLAGLIAIVVDGLLAHDDEIGLLVLDHALQQLGHGERLDALVGLDQDGAVGAHRQRGAQRILRFDAADRDGDDLARLAALLDADGFLDGDLVEGVHRHLDVGEVDSAPVRLDADLDVGIDDPFDGNENLHAAIVPRTLMTGPPSPVISHLRNGGDRTAGHAASQWFQGI